MPIPFFSNPQYHDHPKRKVYVDGHAVFDVSPENGDLTIAPSAGLGKVFDALPEDAPSREPAPLANCIEGSELRVKG